MADDEHIAKLQEGVEAWNEWRQNNPDIKPDVSEANLATTDLCNADLSYANLAGAIIGASNLSSTNLYGANLEGANLLGATLDSADLSHANLTLAILGLGDARDAKFVRTNLYRADLRHLTGYRLDSCYVRDANFAPWARDPWSVLRRQYSGPMFLFHLIFLLIFLGVYAAKAMLWVGVNQAQEGLKEARTSIVKHMEALRATDAQAIADLQQRMEQLWANRSLEPEALQTALQLAEDSLIQSGSRLKNEVIAQLTRPITELSECLVAVCQSEQPIWRVLVRLDEGWWAFALAVGLIVYNILRWVMTWWVGLLRDAESRSGYSPNLQEYLWPYWAHVLVMQPLFFVAIAALLYNGDEILFNTTVVLPQ